MKINIVLSLNRALLLKEINKVKKWPQLFSPLNLIIIICMYWIQVKERLSKFLTYTHVHVLHIAWKTRVGQLMRDGQWKKQQATVSTESKLSQH